MDYYELLFEQMKSGVELGFFQSFYYKFYSAFIINDRWLQYIEGVGTTLVVTAMALVLGVLLGLIVALVRTAHDQQRPGRGNIILGIVNAVCKVYTTVIRGTPMMVQLLIMGMVVFASSRNFTAVGALTLGINSGAYVSEIIRAGILAVDRGQMEAGRSLGLSKAQTMKEIVLPQAFKNVLPPIGNEFITLIKETAIVGYVSLSDLTRVASQISSRTYEAFMPLIGAAVIYFVLIKILTLLLEAFERRLRRSDIR